MTIYLLFHGDDEPTMGGCKDLRGVYVSREAAAEATPTELTWAPGFFHSLRKDEFDYPACCWIDEQEVMS